MSDICELAAASYDSGTDPIDWAIGLAAIEIECREQILDARDEEPGAYPGYHLALDIPSSARRIIGRLLEAGWMPPSTKDAVS